MPLASALSRDTLPHMEPPLLTYEPEPYEGVCPCCYGEPFDGHEDPRLCADCEEVLIERARKARWEMHWADLGEARRMERA